LFFRGYAVTGAIQGITAEKLQKLGLYAKGPQVREQSFLFIRGGADLIIKAKGEAYYFNMASEGHQPRGFASAQEFMDHINRLKPMR
jgi:hypothetical protein